MEDIELLILMKLLEEVMIKTKVGLHGRRQAGDALKFPRLYKKHESYLIGGKIEVDE